jgi:hypothetical protein
MERAELAELSREQLIDLVVALAAEVAELKAQAGGPPKTPANSSAPPSRAIKPNRTERRARSTGLGGDTSGSASDARGRTCWCAADWVAAPGACWHCPDLRCQNPFAAVRAVAGPSPSQAAGMAIQVIATLEG